VLSAADSGVVLGAFMMSLRLCSLRVVALMAGSWI